jgi:LEA14-like dessication related protein
MLACKRLGLSIAGLVLAACSNLGRPAVTPERATVTGVGPSGVELGVALRVDNPNPFALVANGVQGTLFIGDQEGKELGTASTTLDAPIAANSSGEVQSRLDIAWSSAGALRELVGRSEVPYRFEGELGVTGGPMTLSVPFELRGHFTREQLLRLGSGLLSPLLRTP